MGTFVGRGEYTELYQIQAKHCHMDLSLSVVGACAFLLHIRHVDSFQHYDDSGDVGRKLRLNFDALRACKIYVRRGEMWVDFTS